MQKPTWTLLVICCFSTWLGSMIGYTWINPILFPEHPVKVEVPKREPISITLPDGQVIKRSIVLCDDDTLLIILKNPK